MKKYRDNGAIGALLDEYEKAIQELKNIIQPLSQNELVTIIDHETKDKDCESVQTILSHVVQSGYTYVISIRKWLGETVDYKEKAKLSSIAEYFYALDEMFAYNAQLFEDYPNIKLEEYDVAKKIKVRWGQYYDVEQLMEHAIVHILRHRRQIERFMILMKK